LKWWTIREFKLSYYRWR